MKPYFARLPDGSMVRADSVEEMLRLIEEHGEALISKSDGRPPRQNQKARGRRCPNDRRPVLAKGLCRRCYRARWAAQRKLRATAAPPTENPDATA